MDSSSNDADRTTPPTLPSEDTENLQKMATAGLKEPASPVPSAQAADAGEAANPTTPKNPETRFDNSESLPEEDAELSPEEISKLFYQTRAIRKKYGRYFTSIGRLRSAHHCHIFERLPNGELRHQEDIIASNVSNWRNALLHFQDPDKYDTKGKEKEGTRKRKRCPAREDGPNSVNQNQDQQSNPPESTDGSASDATSDAASMRQTPNTEDPCRALSKFEASDLDLLDAEDLSEFAKWISVKIHTLSLSLIQAGEAGKSPEYRMCLNKFMTELFKLQKACFDMEEQLKADGMGEE